MNGNRNNAATFGGAGVPGTGDIIDLAGWTVDQTDDRTTHQITDSVAGGTYNHTGGVHTWDDAAGNGFVGASSFNVRFTGTAHTTVTNYPAHTYYWSFRLTIPATVSIYARNDAVVEGYRDCGIEVGGICDIIGMVFRRNSYLKSFAFRLTNPVITNCERILFDECGTTAYCFSSGVDYINYREIDIVNLDSGLHIRTYSNAQLGFQDSNFDELLTDCGATGVITSRGHNGSPNKFVLILPDLVSQSMTAVLDQPTATDKVYVHPEVGGDDLLVYWDVGLAITVKEINNEVGKTITHYAINGTPLKILGPFTYMKGWDVQDNSSVVVDGATADDGDFEVTWVDQAILSVQEPEAFLMLLGDANNIVTSRVYGYVADINVVPPIGIVVSVGDLRGTYARFFHMQEPPLACILSLVDSTYYFIVTSEPEEVNPTGACTWELTRSSVGSHQHKRWYLKNDGTIIHDGASYFESLLPTIYDTVSGYYLVLFDMPNRLVPAMRGKIEAVYGFRGSIGETSTIIRRTPRFVDVEGITTEESRALWSHPLGSKIFASLLAELFENQVDPIERFLFQWAGPRSYYPVAELSQATPRTVQQRGQYDDRATIQYAFRVVERTIEDPRV